MLVTLRGERVKSNQPSCVTSPLSPSENKMKIHIPYYQSLGSILCVIICEFFPPPHFQNLFFFCFG